MCSSLGSVTFTHALQHLLFCSQVSFPRAVPLFCSVVPQAKPWKAGLRVSLLLRVLVEVSHKNMWNPLVELFFHEHISGAFETSIDESEVAKIALSCHFCS